MLNLNLKKILINFLLFFFIFALDRFSKIFILNLSENSNYFSIHINEFLSFILIWNSGIGFGLFSSENNLFYNLTTFLIGAINLLSLTSLFNARPNLALSPYPSQQILEGRP